jgi:hypothetical protein
MPGRGKKRNIAVFFTLVASALALAAILESTNASFRDEAVDFSRVPDNAVVYTFGLTRRQRAEVKLGYAEHMDPPTVGAFSNHLMLFFHRTAFDEGKANNYFFNYWYADLTLEEMRDYLFHLENIEQLPTDTIIVQIMTPNKLNGAALLGYNGNLPLDIVFQALRLRQNTRFHDYLMASRSLIAATRALFDYGNLYMSIFSTPKTGVLPMDDCLAEGFVDLDGWARFLPSALAARFVEVSPCQMWWRDGKAYLNDGSSREDQSAATNPLGMYPLGPDDRGLQAGDELTIASILTELSNLADRNGRTVVFVVTPIFGSERPSVVNDIFDQAVVLAPNVKLVDHRRMGVDRTLFNSAGHPNSIYFEILADELKARGFVP